MKPTDCAAIARRLHAFHDGELPVNEQIAVSAHLAECGECAAHSADLRFLRSALQALAPGRLGLSNEDASGFSAAIVSRLKAEREASLFARVRLMFDDMHLVYAGVGAAAATMVCVVVMLGMMRFATSERPDSLFGIMNVMGMPLECDAVIVVGDEVAGCRERLAERFQRANETAEQDAVFTLDSLVILSQDVHRVFGGVVPEIASRQHLTAIVPVVERSLVDANIEMKDLDAVAVTHAPGLVGALLVGVSFAKALAYGRGIPTVGVHHMEGHLFATALEHRDAVPPFTALLVSGGHTLLLDVESWGKYKLLGATRDDAAGEAFDKVAKLLGLPYPGGRYIEQLAATGNPKRFPFARPMVRRNSQPKDGDYYAFSFSGLKTAVLNAVRDSSSIEADKADIARGFQDSLIDTLVEKTARAANAFSRQRVVLGGGVACNRTLAAAMRARLEPDGVTVFTPSPRLATDNAAMIARAGFFRFEQGERAGLNLNAYASSPIPGLVAA